MSSHPLPDLRELRHQAKKLYRKAMAEDPDTLATFEYFSKDVSLTSAQLILARGYGFASWARLKAAVEEQFSRGVAAVWPLPKTRQRPPNDELGAVIAASTFLGRSTRGKVALAAVRVYSSGCLLDLEWTLNRDTETFAEWNRDLLDNVQRNPFGRIRSADGRPPSVALLFSVEFADGRIAACAGNETIHLSRAERATMPAILTRQGGAWHAVSGDVWRGTDRLYLSPLPPPGEIRLVLEWPAFAIPETTTVLDSNEILAAAERVQPFT